MSCLGAFRSKIAAWGRPFGPHTGPRAFARGDCADAGTSGPADVFDKVLSDSITAAFAVWEKSPYLKILLTVAVLGLRLVTTFLTLLAPFVAFLGVRFLILLMLTVGPVIILLVLHANPAVQSRLTHENLFSFTSRFCVRLEMKHFRSGSPSA